MSPTNSDDDEQTETTAHVSPPPAQHAPPQYVTFLDHFFSLPGNKKPWQPSEYLALFLGLQIMIQRPSFDGYEGIIRNKYKYAFRHRKSKQLIRDKLKILGYKMSSNTKLSTDDIKDLAKETGITAYFHPSMKTVDELLEVLVDVWDPKIEDSWAHMKKLLPRLQPYSTKELKEKWKALAKEGTSRFDKSMSGAKRKLDVDAEDSQSEASSESQREKAAETDTDALLGGILAEAALEAHGTK